MIRGITEDILKRVYDFSDMTNEELRCKFFQKLQECIDLCNSTSDIVEWLKNEGLEEEVNELLTFWKENGTLEKLINIDKINNLKSELTNIINETKAELTVKDNEITQKVDENYSTVINKIETSKTELTDTINQNSSRLETEISNNTSKVNELKNKNNTNALLSTNASGESTDSSTFIFSVKEAKNMQSICYVNGEMFVGFSLDDGTNGIIIKYDLSGKEIVRSTNIAVEHTSSMAYDKVNNKLYVTNGGGTTGTKVYIVNPTSFNIENTLNYSDLGKSALIAIDKNNNKLLHVGESDSSSKIIYNISTTGIPQKMFEFTNLGTPQGMTVYENSIFYLTNNGLYEFDFTGNILTTTHLYTDGSEPQGLTVGQINGTDVLMYGKNRYKSDTDVNTIYAITNLEAHKKSSLRMIGSYSPKSNSSIFLCPVMVNFSVRKVEGTWTNMNWTNMISASDNVVKEITAGMNSGLGYYEVGVKLNVKLHSYAQCIVTPEQSLFIAGYDVHGQLGADGQTVNIRIKKSNEEGGTVVDPTTLPDGSGLIITLIGGMKI